MFLKDHADFRVVVALRVGNDEFARAGFFQAGDRIQYRRLATAAGPQQAKKFTRVDSEIQLMESGCWLPVIRKNLAEVFRAYCYISGNAVIPSGCLCLKYYQKGP